MTDTQSLLCEFASYPQDTARQVSVLNQLIQTDDQMLTAAELTYSDFCELSEVPHDHRFLPKFIDAWTDFTRNALSHVGPVQPEIRPVELGEETPTLLIVWHFPEYPLLLRQLLARRIMVAVAQDADWLRPLAEAGLTANFRSGRGLIALRRVWQARQSIAMMLDYCYSGTRHRVVDFLGYPCRTPSGLIELALRLNYSIRLVSVSDHCIQSEPLPELRTKSVDAVLQSLNTAISNYIKEQPARWLLWPSLSTRIAPEATD